MTRQVTPFHFIGTGEVARMEEREEKILEDGMMKSLEILSCNTCIRKFSIEGRPIMTKITMHSIFQAVKKGTNGLF